MSFRCSAGVLACEFRHRFGARHPRNSFVRCSALDVRCSMFLFPRSLLPSHLRTPVKVRQGRSKGCPLDPRLFLEPFGPDFSRNSPAKITEHGTHSPSPRYPWQNPDAPFRPFLRFSPVFSGFLRSIFFPAPPAIHPWPLVKAAQLRYFHQHAAKVCFLFRARVLRRR